MNSQTALLSTAYLGCIQYFEKFLIYDKLILEQFENFPKQTYRNRCNIMNANGLQTLSIPVVKSRSKQFTKDVKISYDENWQQHHWRSIESAYRNSPFYEHYIDYFASFYENKFEFLLDFNHQLLETVFEIFEINPTISYSSTYEISITCDDFRESIHPKKLNDNLKSKPYIQVFSNKHGFMPNLSIIDVIFNLGYDWRESLMQE